MRLAQLLAVSLSLSGAFAAPFSFTGSFVTDDQRQTYYVTLASPGTLTARTTSFASGGFASVLSLFEASGSQLLLALDHASPVCGPRSADPSTGFCWDAYLSEPLPAGSYMLALTQDDNTPLGPALTDGFLRSGQGNFTGPEYTGMPGAFRLITGEARTSQWTLEIDADSVANVPERQRRV